MIKKVTTMYIILLSISATIFLILAFLLWINSPGNPVPLLGENGKPLPNSLSEKIFLKIGGVDQGMFIKSKNKENPVLLYMHGGIPDYFLTEKYPTQLEEFFTVVWWEQRGSGLSFHAQIRAETMNLEQMISDTKELTNYLCKRFGKEKIYLMGRSGGSFIGIQAAAQAPELYHAYIGIGQMSHQLKSEKLAYGYMLEKFSEAGNKKMVHKLKASAVSEAIPYKYLKLRDKAMHHIGIGTTHEMKSIITGLFIPSLFFREYTLKEKLKLWRGKSNSGVHPLWNNMIETDLAKLVNEINVPVYFFHGIYDYTVSYPLAKKYFEAIKAPLKGFYTFGNSAHSPLFEEPEKMKRIIITDVLNGKNGLADKN